MPANEETLSMTSNQIKDNLLAKAYDDNVQNNFDCESSGDNEEDYQNDCSRSIVKENFKEVCNYKSLPVREIHEKFIKNFINLILEEAIFEGTLRRNKVVEWIEPTTLHSIIDLKLSDQGCSYETLLTLAHNVIKYSVKTGHPRFINQLYSSVDPYGLLGQWLTDALNPSVYTYEVSPVFSLMVSATAGTTVLGAFDPLKNIAAICKNYNLWFHVDAAWGGGALISECTNVCFWYVPPSKRQLHDEELLKALQKIGPAVKERMMKKGSMLITYQPLRELPNFFRLVLQNSGLTETDMRFFAEEIERLAIDL